MYINGFFLLATYIFLGLCSYVLLVITLSDDANISIIQKKERRGERQIGVELGELPMLPSRNTLGPPSMVGTRSVSLHAHEWALLLPYTVYACHGRYPTADPQLFRSDM